MKVFFWDDILHSSLPDSPCYDYFTGSALAVGGFDGPHIGHKTLCDKVLDYAKRNNKQAGLVTFAHSPRMLKEKDSYAGDISTLRLRLKTFEKWGFDFVIVIDFSKNFSKIEGAIFLRILVEHCAMQFLTVGEGFRCGYKGQTDTAHIETFAKENNICFVIAPLIRVSMHTISSSVVRQFIVSGKLNKCKELLCAPYAIDLQGLNCVVDNEESCMLIDRKSIVQVLPPNGEYSVSIDTKNNSKQFSSVLYLDYINLRLNVPNNVENEQFNVITFI